MGGWERKYGKGQPFILPLQDGQDDQGHRGAFQRKTLEDLPPRQEQVAGAKDRKDLEVALMDGFDWLMVGGFIDYWEEDEEAEQAGIDDDADEDEYQ
ncbi:MAG: hypothetical protein PHY79_18115 [Anaerolineae bacterium]|nr:hypothetical protein [Anaerolineae bacterium]